MVDPLAVDPQGSTTYLQCQPTTNNLYCGRWQRMPCSPGTTFNVNMQLCTWDSGAQPGQFPTAQPPYATASTPGANGGQCTCSSVFGVLLFPWTIVNEIAAADGSLFVKQCLFDFRYYELILLTNKLLSLLMVKCER
ncbi:unnamed protein product [Toxocara canis]|uniref:Chitin-binding type-2 domain-containing protein n=1 Tax=Toxocara canis TaxID=6265 RepID=A0A183V9M9_TOXCA|nr:unnamed protein product [Toxocara canis]